MTATELEALLPDDEALPDRTRKQILALGPAVHGALTALLEREATAIREDTESTLRHRANHAAKLAGELKVESAIPPLIELVQLADADWMILGDAVFALRDIGSAAVDPLLAGWDRFEDHHGPGEVLGYVGKGDERVFQVLMKWFERDPEPAAMALSDLGDSRAIPALRAYVDAFEPKPSPNPMANHVVIELAAAIENLGGELTPEEHTKVERVKRMGAEFVGGLATNAEGERERAASKPGRNDPCHCGSGQKYKKCCLAKDEAERVHGVVMSPRSDDTYASRQSAKRATRELADKHFARKDAREGPAAQMVRFCEPLLDAAAGDPEKVQRALTLGMVFWNVAVAEGELGGKLLDAALKEMAKTEQDAKDLRAIAADMVARHRALFPEMHADRE